MDDINGHRPKPLWQLLRTEANRCVTDLTWSLIRRGQALPHASYIHPRAQLINARHIFISSHCQIYAGATIRGVGQRDPAVTLGRYVIVREHAYVDAHGGWIELAAGAFVGQGAVIYGQGGVVVGNNTLLAPGVTIIAAQHTFLRRDVAVKFQPETFHGIQIGADCWLGVNVVVLDGVTISDGTIVGAGAVVTRNLPAGVIAVGVPARIIRER
jgi:acetyltransferase-like isoleucine patch superfamily enzyme